MTPSLSTCTRLLLPCCVLVALSTGELEFYRDELPGRSENLVLRQLVKYLEAQSHQHHQQQPQRTYFSPFPVDQVQKKHHLELDHQRERDLLETLTDKASLASVLEKENLKPWTYRQTRYNEPINEIPQERGHYLPFYEMNPFEVPLEYPGFKLPYIPRKMNEDLSLHGIHVGKWEDNPKPLKYLPFEDTKFEKGMKGMKGEPLLEFRGSYGRSIDEESDRKLVSTPKFSFKFDDSNLNDRHPFAVKPNNPLYYQDAPFFSDDDDKPEPEETIENDSKWERKETIMEKAHTTHEDTRNSESNFKDASMIALPELERRTGYNPLVVPVNHDLNNDIYFIAIVAGCSAAAMFALVLIALTWCRLKRGAKAAADIEYPAYGVTGPNKEVSPSGDQRLAQSAQMYHFQHQKQQIIAMENSVSATRDPGSVSEAESEEENEEGDYTVYECPGLASTGEMEVKNPLFHDDPTPATPAQNKEEDHI